MAGLTAAWMLAIRRISAHWRTSIAVGAGILLASVILAFVPAYSRAMADLGLRFNVEEEAANATLVTALAPGRGIATELPATEAWILDTVAGETGWYLDWTDTSLRTQRFRAANVEVFGQGAKLTLGAVSSPEQYVDVIAGALPTPGEFEAALAPEVSEALGLGVGDTLDVRLRLTNCFPAPPPAPGQLPPPPDPCNDLVGIETNVPLRISGIVSPSDPEDPYWSAVDADPSRIVQEEDGPLHRVLLDERTMRETLGRLAPSLPVTAAYTFRADLTQLSAGNASAAHARLVAATDDLRAEDVLVISQLDNAFEAFERSTSFSRAPILILAIQVAAVVLVYVGIVAAFLSEELIEETAVLRSRGASVPQVFLLALLEGLTFAVPAVLLGPFIAAWLVSVLGATPLFSDETGGEPLAFSLVPEAFPLAAAGAFAATIVVAVPVAVSARRRALEGRRAHARPAGRPFYQRYFLDVAAVLVAAFLIYQLYRQDSVYDADAFGGLTSDPLLLFAPAIFAVAVVAVFLRLFPLLLRVLAAVLRPAAGPGLDLALTNLARSPGGYARLAVLLTLVFALGAFAATYAPTVDRSYEDRAVYAAGPEIRIEGLGRLDRASAGRVEATLAEIDGVDEAMAVWRGEARLGNDRSVGALFDVLAVGAADVPGMVEWREDFSVQGERAVMGSISTGQNPGLAVPGRPLGFLLDVNSAPRNSVTLWARVRDREGAVYQVSFGKLEAAGWQTYRADFRANPQFAEEIPYPLSILSLYFTEPAAFTTTDTSPILFDNLRAFDDGGEVLLDSFEGGSSWLQFSRDPQLSDSAETKALGEATHGSGVLEYVMDVGRSPGKRGLYFASPSFPVAALASTNFLATTGLRPGSTLLVRVDDHAMPVRIAEAVEYFPTMGPEGRGFLVVDAQALFDWSAAIGESPTSPSEAWIGVEGDASAEAVARGVRSRISPGPVTLREDVIREVGANPVVSAGASGLLGAGFVAAFGVLALAVMLTVLLDARRRTVSTAVLRAVGLTPRAVYGALLFEYAVVLVCGSILGVVLGVQLGDLMLRFLEVTEDGDPVVPPFILETRWSVIGVAFGALVLVTLASIATAGVYLRRVAVARAIRLSE